MYKLISYPINAQAPGWPGNPTIAFKPFTSIPAGDIANTYELHLFNHFGSHMDGPKHFNDHGPNLHEMPLDTFIYGHPLLLDIPKSFRELVLAADLQAYEQQIAQADLLMIRSGFSVERARDPHRYSNEGIGLSAEACKYLIGHFPNLKAVAMDWVSLASYAHQDDGVLAHQTLLGNFDNTRFICIIEDLDFTGLTAGSIKKVIALPLMVEGIDSAPVTVLAELTN